MRGFTFETADREKADLCLLNIFSMIVGKVQQCSEQHTSLLLLLRGSQWVTNGPKSIPPRLSVTHVLTRYAVS